MTNSDTLIATDIVKFIFGQIGKCVDNDRSGVKLGSLEKGLIKGLTSDRNLRGISKYISEMNDFDTKELMDGIEFRVKKRYVNLGERIRLDERSS